MKFFKRNIIKLQSESRYYLLGINKSTLQISLMDKHGS